MSRRLVDRPSTIARRRQALGIDQVAFAGLAYLSQRTLSRIESGQRPPTPAELERLDIALATLEQAQEQARGHVLAVMRGSEDGHAPAACHHPQQLATA